MTNEEQYAEEWYNVAPEIDFKDWLIRELESSRSECAVVRTAGEGFKTMTKPIVHDHYAGSARCIECEGPCMLDGADFYYSHLVRVLFEREALSGNPVFWISLETALRDAGVDIEVHRSRARSLNVG